MKILLIPDTGKPAKFTDRAYYLTAYNDAPLSVGDVICVGCSKEHTATIRAIWFTISPTGPHQPVNRTEPGHKHIFQLDQDFGDVIEQKSVDLFVIGRAD